MGRHKRSRVSKSMTWLAAGVRSLLQNKLHRGAVRSASPDIFDYGRTRQSKSGLFLGEMKSIYRINHTVRTCVDAISADCASAGHIWERVPHEPATPEQEAIKLQLDDLLLNPNPTMSENDLITAATHDLLLCADNYFEVVLDELVGEDGQVLGKTPGQLWPIDSASMFIIPEDDTGILPEPPETAYQQVKNTGDTVNFTANEVIHATEGNLTGRLYGTPRLLSALVLIATQFNAMKFNLKTFTGQKYPKSLVGLGQLQDGDLDRLVAAAEKQADENPNGIIFLDSPALNLLKLIDSNRDMEFNELMKFIERSICAVFRVPPVRIGIAEAGGAGIVVGSTQMAAYWSNIEEIQRQLAESFNLYFRQYLGLKAYRLRFRSSRPDMYSDEAQVEDLRIKNGSLTINEARARHGLAPVAWGNEPPVQAAPMMALPQSQSAERQQTAALPSPMVAAPLMRFNGVRKDVAPGRMEDSPLVDASAEKVQETTRSRLAGSWMQARREMLAIMNEADIITKAIESSVSKARIMSLGELSSRLDAILSDWEREGDRVMAEGNARAYADGKVGQTKDLEVQATPFGEPDAGRLQQIQDQLASIPIRTFRDEQKQAIEQLVAEAHARGETSTYAIRERLEENFRQFSDSQTWKLDRIVRTSIGSANRTARAAALIDAGVEDCKVITANDARVRPSHRAYHNQVVSISEALDVLNEPNCRCRIVKPSKHPDVVPSPEKLAASIQAEEAESARRFALESLGLGDPAA